MHHIQSSLASGDGFIADFFSLAPSKMPSLYTHFPVNQLRFASWCQCEGMQHLHVCPDKIAELLAAVRHSNRPNTLAQVERAGFLQSWILVRHPGGLAGV